MEGRKPQAKHGAQAASVQALKRASNMRK